MLEMDGTSFYEAIKSDKPVVVDFWAAWCMPCKILAPVLEELSGEMEGVASFCKVNVDENGDLAREFQIANIPTVMIFKRGEALERIVGVRPKQEIQELVQKHL